MGVCGSRPGTDTPKMASRLTRQQPSTIHRSAESSSQAATTQIQTAPLQRKSPNPTTQPQRVPSTSRRATMDRLELSDRITMRGMPITFGRFTDVYAGELGPKQEQVAIKVLRDLHLGEGLQGSRGWKRGILSRLQGDMPAWTRVVHARIVPYLGYAMVNGIPTVITKWCPNGTVRDYMRRNPDVNKRALVRQVAEGLKHLHTRKEAIVHGDLKPHNVMIGHDHKAMLCDFGLSTAIEEELSQSTVLEEYRGTVRYTAPELFAGRPCSVKSDVYAFGCLALEIMTARHPFARINGDLAVMRAKMTGQAPSPADYPELPALDRLWNLLQRCWHVDPDRRPTMTRVVGELSSLGYRP